MQRYWWGEGEVKFYIDGDEKYPTICGTGMEDYFGGSWSFASNENGRIVEQNYSTPYLGYPFIPDMIHLFGINIIMMIVRQCVDFTDGISLILYF